MKDDLATDLDGKYSYIQAFSSFMSVQEHTSSVKQNLSPKRHFTNKITCKLFKNQNSRHTCAHFIHNLNIHHLDTKHDYERRNVSNRCLFPSKFIHLPKLVASLLNLIFCKSIKKQPQTTHEYFFLSCYNLTKMKQINK